MKIANKSIEKPSIQIVVLPRPSGDVVFKLGPVEKYNERFDSLYPEPLPPVRARAGQEPVKELTNPDYLKKLEERAGLRIAFLILESLKYTEGLTWETVKADDPLTWANYLNEMRESNISEVEINEIVKAAIKANALDSDALDEARERFLRGQTVQPVE